MAQQLRHSCPVCDDLRAEIAYYKDELALTASIQEAHDLRKRLGLRSPADARLLLRLYRARGHILTRHQLSDSLGEDTMPHAIDVYLSRLRKALGHDALETLTGGVGAVRLTPAGVALVAPALPGQQQAA